MTIEDQGDGRLCVGLLPQKGTLMNLKRGLESLNWLPDALEKVNIVVFPFRETLVRSI